MSLDETSQLLNTLLSQTHKKAEQKVYTNFIGIVSSLKEKGLNEEQSLLIQEKLSSLDLNTTVENKRKYYNQKLNEFKTFLKNEFSFTTEKYYTERGVGLGISLGTAIGLSVGTAINPKLGISLGLSLGISIGLALGISYGTKKDADAKKQGLVV